MNQSAITEDVTWHSDNFNVRFKVSQTHLRTIHQRLLSSLQGSKTFYKNFVYKGLTFIYTYTYTYIKCSAVLAVSRWEESAEPPHVESEERELVCQEQSAGAQVPQEDLLFLGDPGPPDLDDPGPPDLGDPRPPDLGDPGAPDLGPLQQPLQDPEEVEGVVVPEERFVRWLRVLLRLEDERTNTNTQIHK